MTIWGKLGVLLLAGGFLAGCADGGMAMKEMFESPAVSARKKLMKAGIAKNFKAVKAAVKAGKYKDAEKAAKNLAKAARKLPKAYAKKDLNGVTRALPAIWKNKGDFTQKSENLAAASEVFAQIWAKSGNKAKMNDSIKIIGKNCGACHKPYRAKKKKAMKK